METEQYSTLIGAAVPVVKGAIGAAMARRGNSTGIRRRDGWWRRLGAMSDARRWPTCRGTVA